VFQFPIVSHKVNIYRIQLLFDSHDHTRLFQLLQKQHLLPTPLGKTSLSVITSKDELEENKTDHAIPSSTDGRCGGVSNSKLLEVQVPLYDASQRNFWPKTSIGVQIYLCCLMITSFGTRRTWACLKMQMYPYGKSDVTRVESLYSQALHNIDLKNIHVNGF